MPDAEVINVDPALYGIAQTRMCEIIKERGVHNEPGSIIGTDIWLSYLEPAGCNPGAVWDRPDEPWWTHWTAWTPRGSRFGIADNRHDAVKIVEQIWGTWL